MKNSLSTLAALAACASTAAAQENVIFSIDWMSPTVALPSCTSLTPITAGDMLRVCGGLPGPGPLPTPEIAITGGAGGLGLALHPFCVGFPPGFPCGVEVDAFSDGRDDYFDSGADLRAGTVWFSVDEFASGFPGAPAAPNLLTEFPEEEGSSDVFLLSATFPPPPLIPLPGAHVGALDGDGFASGSGYAYPGLGLIEPTPPLPGISTVGDNVDAFNFDASTTGSPPHFFSLDSTFLDPCSVTSNSTSAAAASFVGGDVLLSFGGAPGLFAPATLLGLDLVGGPDSDDLDALILRENGSFVFEPSAIPYDWETGLTDMLLFSVRRGSAVIGELDSIFGIPIEEGDILVPPIVGSTSPYPGIFIPAENLGLATARSATAGVCLVGDDLDALEHREEAQVDCNGNGIEDAIDIAFGTSDDANQNGVPDECESADLLAMPYCFCGPGLGPCGNDYPAAGCENSTGVGSLLTASGSSDVDLDDLVLTAVDVPPFQFGIIYYGTLPTDVPFGDGRRCVDGNICRFGPQFSGAAGELTEGPGIVAESSTSFCPILAGDTWYFQAWYRDPAGDCATGFNLSNAIAVVFYD